MNELDWSGVNRGTRVKMLDVDKWVEGEVTIVREKDCKVIFDSPCDLDYTYYRREDLELVDAS